MPTLTETRIEIADRHTSLCFLREPPADGALGTLGFGTLYEQVCSGPAPEFGELFHLTEAGLGRLRPVWAEHNHRFWREYLGREFDPETASQEALPILAAATDFIRLSALPMKAAPMLSVALYPFGWSTWLSLRVTKSHTLVEIEQLVTQLFQSNLVLLSDGTALSLPDLFDHVAVLVRTQVFAGHATQDEISRDTLVTTTVLSKFGGSPSTLAMTEDDQKRIRRIVSPRGKLSEKPFADYIYPLSGARQELNYLIYENLGRFIWLEKLLAPKDRNRQNLACYHNNNFFSLLQAWQWEGFLSSAGKLKPQTDAIKSLAEIGLERLRYPKRKNAGLLLFLQSPLVTRALDLWKKV